MKKVKLDFEKLKKDLETMDTKTRSTSHKFAIRCEYDKDEHFYLLRKNKGQIELKIKCHIPVKSVETFKCDMGHWHEVERKETWIWNYVTLSKDEVEQLREWLL